jgi:hypothetical protein
MKTYSLLGAKIRPIDDGLLRHHESNDCPPGSTCAQAAVETVRRRLLEKKRIPLSLARSRFVQKTGFTE